MHNEELASGGVGVHGSCHGKNARSVFQIIGEMILGEFALNAVSRAAHAVAVGASALDHKAVDNAVEDQTVIKSFIDQADKVVYSVGSDFRIKFCLHHIAVFHSYGYNWICHCFLSPFQKVLYFPVRSIIICKE